MRSIGAQAWAWIGAAALCGLVWAASAARATTVEALSLEELSDRADLVVQGTVERSGTRVVVRKRGVQVVTVSRLRVSRWLKGSGGDSVLVREHGGKWAGGFTRVDGTPHYAPGEEVVAFLERGPRGHLQTLGMSQGQFVVVPGVGGMPSVVRRDMRGLAVVRWAGGSMQLSPGAQGVPVTLEELVAFVETRVEQREGPSR